MKGGNPDSKDVKLNKRLGILETAQFKLSGDKMAKLALMCKSKNYQLDTICPGQDEYRTGQWVISPKKRRELLGEDVVLTMSRKTPAYMGGKIIGFSPLENGKVEVIFKEDPSLVGSTDAVNQSGWGSGRGVCYIK